MATAPRNLDMPTWQRIRENMLKNKERQTTALQRTLDELTFLEKAEHDTPGAYIGALAKIRAKRDRQHANLQGTEAYLRALEKNKP